MATCLMGGNVILIHVGNPTVSSGHSSTEAVVVGVVVAGVAVIAISVAVVVIIRRRSASSCNQNRR